MSIYHRVYVCDPVPMLVGQVFYVMVMDWKALGVIGKKNTIYRYKIKVCFVVCLKRLCSKHEQVSLKRKETLSFWVEQVLKLRLSCPQIIADS